MVSHSKVPSSVLTFIISFATFESNLYQHFYPSFTFVKKSLPPPTPPDASLYAGIQTKLFTSNLQNSSPLTHAFNWARNLVKSAVNLKKIFPNLARLIFRVPPCQKMIKNQLELFITGLDLIQLRSRIWLFNLNLQNWSPHYSCL